jgi:Domain of unknown function (DUF4116)
MSATRRSTRLAAKPRVEYFESENEYAAIPEDEIPVAERFIKLLRKDENHRGLKFKTGLNVDIQSWRPQEDCSPGGIYFCRLNQLHKWLDLYDDVAWCRWVSIPADAEVVDCGDLLKFKANKVILSERVPVEEIIHEYFDMDELYKLNKIAAGFMDPSDPKTLEYVRNEPTGKAFGALKIQPHELSLEMVSKDYRMLYYVREQTPEICMAAVNNNGEALQYVREQTPEICMTAVAKVGWVLRYVKQKTQELCIAAIKSEPYAFYDVPDEFRTHELCVIAVSQRGHYLFHIKNQTFEMCMAAVSNDGYALKYVKLPDTEACRLPDLYVAAVSQHGCALQYVPTLYRTYSLCMTAVKQNGYALKYVPEKYQTRDICTEALSKAKHADKYMKKKHNLTIPVPAASH